MTDISRWIRDGDPLAREQELSTSAVQSLRRTIVAAAAQPAATTAWWPQPMFVAATIAATLVAGVAIGRWLPADSAVSGNAVTHSTGISASRRQLQIASPGGTRVIWVFDPEFIP